MGVGPIGLLAIPALAGMLGGLFGGKEEPASPASPTMVNAGGTANPQTPQQAEDKVRKQAALANGAGKSGTILTSPLGLLDQAANGKTSLLGQ